MTTTVTPTSTATVTTSYGIGAATTVVAATLTTLFAHDWMEVLITVPGLLVVAAIVFGVVVPRGLRTSSSGTALTLAILAAVAAVAAFWTGLPAVFGVGAMILGDAGRRSRSGGGKAIAALVLGALAVLFYLSIYVLDGIAGNVGFLVS